MRLFAVAIAAVALVVPVDASNDTPEAAIRRFMEAIYSNNKSAAQKASIPNVDVTLLIGTEPLSFAQLSALSRETAAMELRVVQPFNSQGRRVTADSDGNYPVGTRARYITFFRNTPLVVSVLRTENGWKVDPRWWLAAAREGPEPDVQPGTPEFAVKAFLTALVTHDRDGIREFVMPTADVKSIFEDAPSEPDYSDQVVMLAIEMPLVEIPPGEFYVLPSGDIVGGSKEPKETKLLVGLYGSLEMPFIVQRVKNEWRVLPQSYFKLINEN